MSPEIYGFFRQFWVVWLLILFAGIVVYVFWPSRKRDYERKGEIPFKDEGLHRPDGDDDGPRDGGSR